MHRAITKNGFLEKVTTDPKLLSVLVHRAHKIISRECYLFFHSLELDHPLTQYNFAEKEYGIIIVAEIS